MTSCEALANKLSMCRCDGRHEHAHLEGSYRGKPLTSYAETYPRKMRRVIAEVLAARQSEQHQIHDVFAELEDDDLVASELMPDADGDDAQWRNPKLVNKGFKQC